MANILNTGKQIGVIGGIRSIEHVDSLHSGTIMSLGATEELYNATA